MTVSVIKYHPSASTSTRVQKPSGAKLLVLRLKCLTKKPSRSLHPIAYAATTGILTVVQSQTSRSPLPTYFKNHKGWGCLSFPGALGICPTSALLSAHHLPLFQFLTATTGQMRATYTPASTQLPPCLSPRPCLTSYIFFIYFSPSFLFHVHSQVLFAYFQKNDRFFKYNNLNYCYAFLFKSHPDVQ